MARLTISRAGPSVSVQDEGRPGLLAHGVPASGAMDRSAYRAAGALTGAPCGAALEFSAMGLGFTYAGDDCLMGFAGGGFMLSINGKGRDWPGSAVLSDGDAVEIAIGPWGNYGYVRFGREIGVPAVLGSRATHASVGLGGFEGRALVAGDTLELVPLERAGTEAPEAGTPMDPEDLSKPVRFVWGLHADLFPPEVRQRFCTAPFRVSARMNRMGVRLDDSGGVFSGQHILSLVSDSVICGDIQILGDGTPIVLLRDHQPTGGYPRIATVIDADCDRFAQIRPDRDVLFRPVSLAAAHEAMGVRR